MTSITKGSILSVVMFTLSSATLFSLYIYNPSVLIPLHRFKHYSIYECIQKQLTTRLRNVPLSNLNDREVSNKGRTYCTSNVSCSTPKLLGYVGVPKKVNINDLVNISKHELSFVKKGGWWLPPNCTQTKTVAIIVPYRDRQEHLVVLLRHLHPILRRQQLHYRLFIIQQDKNFTFNRGKLFNVGVREALKFYPYNCIVMHDVDLIPEDDRIDYSCNRSPKLMSVCIDKYHYTGLGGGHFGGVVSMTINHYIKTNGYTNNIWAWGGEDDGLYRRLVLVGLRKAIESTRVARYTMLSHVDRRWARSKEEKKEILRILDSTRTGFKTDGYSSVVYRVNEIKTEPLFTLIDVNLMKNSIRG